MPLTLALLPLLGLAIYWAVQQLRFSADLAEGDFAAAVTAWPQNADGWRNFAERQVDQDLTAARASARRAVRLNPEDWENWAELADLDFESDDSAAARADLSAIAPRQHGFDGPWRYANLLLLSGDTQGFWNNAGRALAFAPANEMQRAFAQCLAVAGDKVAPVSAVVRNAQRRTDMPGEQSALTISYFTFLTSHQEVDEAGHWWPELLAHLDTLPSGSSARDAGQRYVQLLSDLGQPQKAITAWQQGVHAGLFDAALGPAHDNLVVNGNFAQPIEPGVFNWSLCTTCRVWTSIETDDTSDSAGTSHSPALRLDFRGDEAATVLLAQERVLLAATRAYTLRFSSVRLGTGSDTGVFAAIADASGHALARTEAPMLSTWREASLNFVSPAQPGSYWLQVGYERPLGQIYLRGSVLLTDFTLQPSSDATRAGAKQEAAR